VIKKIDGNAAEIAEQVFEKKKGKYYSICRKLYKGSETQAIVWCDNYCEAFPTCKCKLESECARVKFNILSGTSMSCPQSGMIFDGQCEPITRILQDVIAGSCIYVCADGSRDVSYDVCGYVLIEKFNEEIQLRGLKDQISVLACSHIGGHNYAGNLITFSPGPNGKIIGHWYDNVTPNDVLALLDQHIAKGRINYKLNSIDRENMRVGLQQSVRILIAAGTIQVGYLDPEYYISQQSTDKSDVYSFCVILLELISGQEEILNESFGLHCRNIVQREKLHIVSGVIQGIIYVHELSMFVVLFQLQHNKGVILILNLTNILLADTPKVTREGIYFPSLHLVVCKCGFCGTEKQALNGWQLYKGSKLRDWTTSIIVKDSRLPLEQWMLKVTESHATTFLQWDQVNCYIFQVKSSSHFVQWDPGGWSLVHWWSQHA